MSDRSANIKRYLVAVSLACIAIGCIALSRATADEPTRNAKANRPAAAPDADVFQDGGPAVGNQAVSITTDRAAYAPGDTIVLGMHLKNLSDEEIRGLSWGNKDVFHISVSLPDGKPAPMTLYGEKYFSRRSSGVFGGDLKPGQIKSHDVELNRLYDFSLEGKYKVTVDRTIVVSKDGEFEVAKAVSNQIEITVRDSTPARAK